METRKAPGAIGCIGTGPIGRSWAVVFARAGYQVKLFDAAPSASAEAEAYVLAAAPGADVVVCVSLQQALEGSFYVQESVREHEEEKRTLYQLIDGLAGETTIVGSSTSIIPGSLFQSDLAISPRCLVVHPTNPPHLVPLTEICPGKQSANATVDAVYRLMADIGQAPVLIRREVSGFVLNRLQCALVKEALWLVEGGVIDPMDLDLVIKKGLGLRWVLMGPFETGHLNADGGYADYMRKYEHVFNTQFKALDHPQEVVLEVVDRVDAALRLAYPEGVAARQAWRDGQLAALHISLAEMANRATQGRVQ